MGGNSASTTPPCGSRATASRRCCSPAPADVGGGYPLAGGERSRTSACAGCTSSSSPRACASRVDPAVAFRVGLRPNHQPWTEFPWTLAPRRTARERALHRCPNPSLMARIARGGVYAVLPSGAQDRRGSDPHEPGPVPHSTGLCTAGARPDNRRSSGPLLGLRDKERRGGIGEQNVDTMPEPGSPDRRPRAAVPPVSTPRSATTACAASR